MSIVDTIFAGIKRGRNKGQVALPSQEIAAKLQEFGAKLEAARADLVKAQAAREHALSSLEPTGMEEADRRAALARNEIEIAEHAIASLRPMLARALETEAADALTTRRAEIERRIATEASETLNEYDRVAAGMAKALSKLAAIDAEVDDVNRALKAAGRTEEAVTSVESRYRCKPGKQEPDRVETVEEWRDKDGSFAVQRFYDESGQMSSRYGATLVKRAVVHPGRKHRDKHLPSLSDILLPAGRIGGAQHWPREGQ